MRNSESCISGREWALMRFKDCLVPTSGSQEIKGKLFSEPDKDLYPAYSASGQDVWSKVCDFKKDGIVVSAVGARCGKCFRANGHWTTAANTHVIFTRKGFDRDFFWYIINNEDWWFKGGTAQPFVHIQATLNQPVAVPTLPEQQSIAAFLDHHTSLIDRERSLIDQKIELLREKRKALIFECVTGKRMVVQRNDLGKLNDQVDVVGTGSLVAIPTPELPDGLMVDSGVEWIGEISEGWCLRRFKDVAILSSGKFIDKNNETGVNEIYGANGSIGKTNKKNVFKEKLIIGRVGSVGALNLISGGFVTDNALIVTTKNFIDVKYLYFLLSFFDFSNITSKTSQPLLTSSSLYGLPIVFPSFKRQVFICEFLDVEAKKIDQEIALLTKKNELLSEKRKALIFEAVTGKIDCRSWNH